jgi:hypothetical protein
MPRRTYNERTNMKVDEMFPSKYLKASDAESGPIVTMKNCTWETLKNRDEEDEEKPVLYFEEYEKGLVLNRTNAKTIQNLYGDDTAEWAGKRVQLTAVDVDAFGQVQRALRISPKKPPIDKATLMKHYQALWEKAKKLKVEGVENYVIAPEMHEDEITALGKELKEKVDAAEAFTK